MTPLIETSAARALRASVRFFVGDTSAGMVLMSAALIAVIWANVSPSTYEPLWRTPVSLGIRPLMLSKPVILWINDGLMAVFFFVVGLEIKREVVRGELASIRHAALPVAAAAGGMVVPGAIYAGLNAGSIGEPGWGIPVATDIAFALGVLALLGGRVAPSLRIFLTAVAIADDLGAIAIIAVFYTRDLNWISFAVAGTIIALLAIMNRADVQYATPYVLLGFALWIAILKSGVHATVAGVLLAFLVPATQNVRGRTVGPLLDRFEHGLAMWVRFAILPIFALANAGAHVSAAFATVLTDRIALGIIFGLFFGKQVGVSGACWLLIRSGFAALPSGVTWPQLYGVALLCGIGFTMSLFIATLAFNAEAQLESAKVGVLTGSLLAGVVGSAVLSRSRVR